MFPRNNFVASKLIVIAECFAILITSVHLRALTLTAKMSQQE